jgi:hypothetical protein
MVHLVGILCWGCPKRKTGQYRIVKELNGCFNNNITKHYWYKIQWQYNTNFEKRKRWADVTEPPYEFLYGSPTFVEYFRTIAEARGYIERLRNPTMPEVVEIIK